MKAEILLIAVLLATIQSAPSEDQVNITDFIYKGHRWYSGYLNFTEGDFHYVFFQSQHDPDNDPIVLWLNGGPGCSSLIGMVYQNGPFVFKINTTDLVLNDFAWNKKANLLYIQSPQGVGFSKVKGGKLPPLTDERVAIYNLKALLTFYNKFQNLKKNSLYLTGQSYSGIYVPYLANQIIKHNKLPSSKDQQILLKGIMVGNACTYPGECYIPEKDGLSLYQYQFLFKHAFYSQQEYDHMMAACAIAYSSQECQQQRQILDGKFNKTKTSILNIYAPCYQQNLTKKRTRQSVRFSEDAVDCEDSKGGNFFFNQFLIQEQLNVDLMRWEECNDEVFDEYVIQENASYWLYPLLMKENLKIWVFSGDIDASVPITGTISWIIKLRQQFNIPVLQPWRQWWVPGLHKHEDQVGGMVWKMRGLTFASVKGAGHMVPLDKRNSAYVLIDSFLYRENLPQKDEGL